MIKIGLCDDEKNVLSSISKILESTLISLEIDAEIVVASSDQNLILSAIKNRQIDVLFLDIDFKDSDKNGIKFAKELRSINSDFKLIFLTGHFEYSLLAFKCKTFDYILKPITVQNLSPTMRRLKADLENRTNKFLKVNKNFTLRTDDILFIERNKSKAVFYTICTNYESCYSLNEIHKHLPPSFVRIHRSYIINPNRIKTIDKERKIIIFENNSSCPIGDFKEF